jgi:hypothetical protein
MDTFSRELTSTASVDARTSNAPHGIHAGGAGRCQNLVREMLRIERQEKKISTSVRQSSQTLAVV